MTTASNPNNNLSPWKPGQSGDPTPREGMGVEYSQAVRPIARESNLPGSES